MFWLEDGRIILNPSRISLQVNLDLGAVALHPLPDSLKLHETEDENDREHDVVHAEQEDCPLPLSLKSTLFWHMTRLLYHGACVNREIL